jgi:hypothetical protein
MFIDSLRLEGKIFLCIFTVSFVLSFVFSLVLYLVLSVVFLSVNYVKFVCGELVESICIKFLYLIHIVYDTTTRFL